ncbi:MAG: hypothetical protein BroJett003_21170 [Planctomycetota bacterium]|nr:MAG: hypothetical protein BroJett003_21170 [Planctomycetota bacterium]
MVMILTSSKGRILHANARVHDLLGYDPGDLIGREAEERIPEGVRAAHVRMREAYLENPHPRPLGIGRDLTALTHDGQIVSVEIGLSPLNLRAETSVLGSIIDVSERKKLEQRYRAMLEHAPTACGALRHGSPVSRQRVARVPDALTVIKEFTAIIVDGLAGPVSQQQTEYLRTVLDRVDDLATMIDDMLDISKLEAGLLGIARKPCLLEDVRSRVRVTLERKGGGVGRGSGGLRSGGRVADGVLRPGEDGPGGAESRGQCDQVLR